MTAQFPKIALVFNRYKTASSLHKGTMEWIFWGRTTWLCRQLCWRSISRCHWAVLWRLNSTHYTNVDEDAIAWLLPDDRGHYDDSVKLPNLPHHHLEEHPGRVLTSLTQEWTIPNYSLFVLIDMVIGCNHEVQWCHCNCLYISKYRRFSGVAFSLSLLASSFLSLPMGLSSILLTQWFLYRLSRLSHITDFLLCWTCQYNH